MPGRGRNRQRRILADDYSPHPLWPTAMRSALKEGRLIGVANDGSNKIGSVWLARTVPLAPVLDAKTSADRAAAAAPLEAAFGELANLAPVTLKRRATSMAGYREWQLLLINVPRLYRPPFDHPLFDDLSRDLGGHVVENRELLFLTQLKFSAAGSATSDRWRDTFAAATSSFAASLVGDQGVSLADFDRDYRLVDAALTRAGLGVPTGHQIALANSWWNHGRSADLAYIPHPDHLHLFTSVNAGIAARSYLQQDGRSCDDWEHDPAPEEWAVTFTTVSDFEWDFDDALSPRATWISDLLRLGALAVSVRGSVEPSAVTREEIRRQKTDVIRDINERYNQGKLERAEQEEMLQRLGTAEDYFATTPPPAALVGVSTVAALDGRVGDLDQLQGVGRLPFRLSVMENRQPAALAETMMCSPARANPYVHDLSSQMLSFSGAPSLSTVGDGDGALLGFTENDRQPVYFSPTIASRDDAAPICMVAGGTGSGKTLIAQWLAHQIARIPNRRGEQTPVVVINPKAGADISAPVLATGGQISNLDDLVSSDGILDPIRFSGGEAGIGMASSMLSRLNPWGSAARMQEFEVPMLQALRYGVTHGASSIGQALIAARDGLGDELPAGMIDPVLRLATSEPMAKSLIGIDPHTEGLKAAAGLTLIQSGTNTFNVDDQSATDMISKLKRAIARNLVYGSQMALAHRQGVVMFDEAWVFLEGGKAEMDQLGRTARSQEVLAMMFTQKVTDAVKAELAGYISRMLTLAIEDKDEATAALTLTRWEDAPADVLTRIRAKSSRGGAHNWHSLRALVDPRTRRVVRGSVAYFSDLAGRTVPVEVVVPDWFLTLASTNPDDIARRVAVVSADRVA